MWPLNRFGFAAPSPPYVSIKYSKIKNALPNWYKKLYSNTYCASQWLNIWWILFQFNCRTPETLIYASHARSSSCLLWLDDFHPWDSWHPPVLRPSANEIRFDWVWCHRSADMNSALKWSPTNSSSHKSYSITFFFFRFQNGRWN